MKITDIAEQITEDASDGIFVGFVDEAHVGWHPITRWEATSNGSHAAEQADRMAADSYDDILVLKFRDGKAGFNTHYRAKSGRDVEADVAAHRDGGLGHENALGNDHEPSYDKSDL